MLKLLLLLWNDIIKDIIKTFDKVDKIFSESLLLPKKIKNGFNKTELDQYKYS